MQLETDEGTFTIDDVAALNSKLRRLNRENNQRAILLVAGEIYLQTAVHSNGFVIEKREGSEDLHFYAQFRGGRPPIPPPDPPPTRRWWHRLFPQLPVLAPGQHVFTDTEVLEIFELYFLGKPDPSYVEWIRGYGF